MGPVCGQCAHRDVAPNSAMVLGMVTQRPHLTTASSTDIGDTESRMSAPRSRIRSAHRVAHFSITSTSRTARDLPGEAVAAVGRCTICASVNSASRSASTLEDRPPHHSARRGTWRPRCRAAPTARAAPSDDPEVEQRHDRSSRRRPRTGPGCGPRADERSCAAHALTPNAGGHSVHRFAIQSASHSNGDAGHALILEQTASVSSVLRKQEQPGRA